MPEPEPVTASTAPQEEEEAFTPASAASANSGDCEVRVTALLRAERFRGSGAMTPALAAQLERDPEFARMYDEESHFDEYIECSYEVRLGHTPGKRYRWRHEVSNTLDEHTTAVCNALASSVASDVIATTRDCTDLTAGAYWGKTLTPL